MTAAEPIASANRHFLAKDYAGFREMILGELKTRLATDFTPHPASIEVALAESLAYVADYLSYHQDAVATEAYLQTARQRLSVARHARLLGYGIGEGCSARTIVCFVAAADGATIAAGAQLLPAIDGVATVGVPARYATDDRVVFETLEPVRLWRAHNRIALTSRSPQVGDVEARCRGTLDRLAPGDALVLKHDAGWAHPLRLVAVEPGGADTLLRWHDDDALPATLPHGEDWALLGNAALAQHGRTTSFALPGTARETTLRCPELAFAVDDDAIGLRRTAAATALAQDPHVAEPMLTLSEVPVAAPWLERSRPCWRGRRSLIGAGPLDRIVAVEPLDDERVLVSFGDGRHGRHRLPDFQYVATVRVGRGTRGNIGAGALAHLVDADPAVLALTNPAAATGGAAPETLASARAAAPATVSRQDRLVTDTDLTAAACAIPGIRAALVHRAFDGVRERITVTVARSDDKPVPDALAKRIERALRPHALLGQRLRVRGASYAQPHVVVRLVLADERRRRDVEAAVRTALAALRLGFGEALQSDTVETAVCEVDGVLDAEVALAVAAEPESASESIVVPAPDVIVRIDAEQVRIDGIIRRPAP